MSKTPIATQQAPAAIGPYSQAIQSGNTVYLSGQIPLVPETMEMAGDTVQAQAEQVFKNLKAVCEAAGASLQDMVKVQIYMTDLSQFGTVNEIMSQYFVEPYPARATVEVSALPKGSLVEIDGILVVPEK